jgi:EAL and modified HD-GYP domain-containing signal transduction protein
MTDTENNDIFIARQPILDKNLEIYGYELFSRNSKTAEKSNIEHTESSDSEMLFNVLSTFDMEHLLSGKYAFLNCTLDSLSIDHFSLISPTYVNLEIKRPSTLTSAIISDIHTKLQTLKSIGYTIASDDFVFEDEYASWVAFIDIIKIQADKSNQFNQEVIKKAKSMNKKIVAELVETQAQYQIFKDLGVDFFQGYFFCKPITMGAKITNPSVTNLIRLINLTSQEADIFEIEKVLKTDPTLSFKLLRYINSSGFGLRCTVESFKHAIMILGYKKLFKWLTLLFSTTNKTPGSGAVSKMAITRARFMELIGGEFLGKASSDNCFVVGMFSLLEVMLNVPLEVSLGSISLPEVITDALLNGEGDYAPLLNLTLALENNDWVEILATANELGLTSKFVTNKHMEALEWCNQLNLSN